MPKVSVIVPVYNVEKYLRQCLDSLVNQTLTDIEIICINDGSTDGSLAILEDYASKDKRIRLISQENQGQGVARNRGIELSSGEYIGFVDPDDWVELNTYEELYSKAKEQSLDIVEYTYKEYNLHSGTTKIWNNKIKIPENEIFTFKKCPLYTFFSTMLGPCNKIYRTNFIKNNNIKFSNSKLAEDHIFTIKSRIFANKIIFINKPFYNYRVYKGSSCKRITNQVLNVIDIVKEVENLLISLNKYNDLKNEYKKYAGLTLARQIPYIPQDQKTAYEEKIKKEFTKEIYKQYKYYKYGEYKFIEKIFSLKNEENFGKRYKILMLFGLKLKIKRGKKETV